MRLVVAMRQKDAGSGNQVLRRYIYRANDVLDMIQPWLRSSTTANYRWFPGNGDTAVLFRSNEPESSEMRSGWISNKKRAWAWSGVVGQGLYQQLKLESPESSKFYETVAGADGSFALIGASPREITVSTNSHRSESMYWGEDKDIIIFSNSAALINLMLNDGHPKYSALGVAGALVHALPLTTETIFCDVKIVEPGVTVRSSRDNGFEYVLKPERDYAEGLSLDQLSESVAASLVSYADALSAGASNIRAAVTGGKDSRLVVAALSAAGKKFETYTNGLNESGDVRIGAAVAEAIGVKHRVITPPIRRSATGGEVVVGVPELQAWNTLRSTGGLGNAFTAMPDPHKEHQPISDVANFGGQGGEIIRGGFLRLLPPGGINRDSARAFLLKTWLNNEDILSPLAKEACLASVSDMIDLASTDPYEALFRSYVERRTGRWLSTMRHGESVGKAHTTLLINNSMVVSMLRQDPRLLAEERLAFKVLQQLRPDLLDIPFFRDRWAFEQDGPSDFYSPNNWIQREPYTAHKQPRASFNWRVAYSRSLSNFFRDYIFSFDNSLMFDVIDRKRVEQVLNGRSYRAPLAWALYSTQYALSNAWLSDTPPAHPEEVEVSVP